MSNRTLCRHCEECQTYTYHRIGNNDNKIEFTYCNGNKDIVNASNWYIQKDGYAYSTRRFWGEKRFLHTIYKSSKNVLIDHHDGNRKNNILKNLRVVTHRCNSQNKHVERTSIFPGVHKVKNKYISKIIHNKKSIYLGTFTDEIEAFHAYVNYCKDHNLTINRELEAFQIYTRWLNNNPQKVLV